MPPTTSASVRSELIGISAAATNGFIRLPFVMEGVLVGAVGGGIACGILAGALHFLMVRVLPTVPFINEFRLTLDLPVFCASLVIGGAVLGMFGSLFSLRRFLQPA